MLVLEKRSRLIFHLEGSGKARLLVDGEVLVPEIGKPNDSERLRSGEHEFVIEYEAPADGDAALRLFWEGRDFSREPVPATVFAHRGDDSRLLERIRLREGRMLLAQKRCLSCHDAAVVPEMAELDLAAPSLTGVGERLQEGWMAKWIANPHAVRPSAHMPAVFGEDAEQKAADIAAYLSAGVPKVIEPEGPAPDQVERGGHIFYEQGCVACHTLDEKGDSERIGLKSVSHKFRPGGLADFLRDPAEFHEATRMPDFKFDEKEAAALESFLRSLGDPPPAEILAGNPERGRELASSSGCYDCHEREGEESSLEATTPLFSLASVDCSAVRFDYGAEGASKEALAAFLKGESSAKSLTRFVPAEFADRQYDALRCNACHMRDGEQTLREKYAAEVGHLKPPPPAASEDKPAVKSGPPPLDYLGLKLRPEWRTKLFLGAHEAKVRPWLPARMPAFASRAEALSTGFSHLAGLPAKGLALPPIDAGKLAAGAALTGVQGGLACGTCHGIGDKPAIAVFEGEGPNLRDAGARLRSEYFHLWMNDPLRLWPGTIMPKYATEGKTPLTQHYEGDARQQFDAILEYLRSLSNN